jgi:glycosyltransferase involved in cell wall biosynthesis
MRVGLVVTGGLDRSGRERVVPALLWLVERLARRCDLHVFVLRHYPTPQSYALAGATIHDLGRVERPPGLRRARTRARLRRAIARTGPFDVLHAYWGVPAIITLRVARSLGVPLVATLSSGELVAVDAIEYGLQRRWLDRRAIAGLVARADRLTVPTEYLLRMPQLRDRRVDIVPMGVPTDTFRPGAAPAGPPWRVLRVASLNPVKDYPLLLAAYESVVSRLPAVHLDVVGEDTLGGSIQAMARARGLEPFVTFHGFQPTDVLARMYERAHVHVVSSRHEASSVAVLEAAAAGVPTVGTSVGYVADWAAHDRALAVPVGDADALAAAILALLRNDDRRRAIAARARAWTLEHDADWTAAQFEQIYEEVVREGSATRSRNRDYERVPRRP